MAAEVPKAVKQALSVAPTDPVGKANEYAHVEIERWKNSDLIFKNEFETLMQSLDEKERECLVLYLAVMAITIKNQLQSPSLPFNKATKEEIQRQAGITLFQLITLEDTSINPKTVSEDSAVDLTFKLINKSRLTQLNNIPNNKNIITSEAKEAKTKDLLKLRNWLYKTISEFEKILKDEGRPPEIREYIDIRKAAIKFGKENGINTSSLKDFIIGNLLLTAEMEEDFADIPERIGFSGSKKLRIEGRAQAYKDILREAKFNMEGYQPLGIGWPGLIDRFKEYLDKYNLKGYIPENGAAISYAATDGILRSYMLARYTLREELFGKDNSEEKEKFHPRILFPTPGFTMVGKIPRELGMETKEMVTKIEDDFFINPDKLKEFLKDPKNDDVLIVDLSIINNPSSTIVPPEQLRQVLEILENHSGRSGAKVIVINDCAYLGMGNQDRLKETGSIMNNYSRRIDVLPMTKIFGRPSLRCGFIGTPDKSLAQHIPAITKDVSPSMAYDMMADAMAIWDFVKHEDQMRFFEMLHSRQLKMLDILTERPDIFDLEESFISGPEREKESEEEDALAAFYLYIKVKEGINPLFIPALTGLFVNMDDTFYLSQDRQGSKYVRFALGVESLPKKKVKQMKRDLRRWKKINEKYPIALN